MPEVTFTGTPEWYGGQTGIIKNLANRARQVTTAPFKPYPNARIAPFTPLQEQSFNLGKQEVTNPVYGNLFNRSAGAIKNALGQDITGDLQPFIERGVSNPVENAQEYMNPYNQEVVENIGRLASRNLTENILPNINDQFIRSGSYGSSGGPGSRSHQDITGRAIRDTQDAVARAQAEALQGGYNKALETSVGQQERNLQAGRLFGGAKAEDIQRQILGGRELQNLSSQYQGERRQGIGLLGQLGNQQQQQGQQGLNTAFADWQSERNYPYIQAARESELVRGLQPGQYTSNTASYMPQAPQASPWSQGAGLLTGLIGSANQRQGFSEGGSVNDRKMKLMNSVAHLRHYADGGSVPLSPIQRGVNDALDTSEIQSMRAQANKLDQMQVNPFWSAIARTGFNMASKRTPGVLANLGEAANEGMNEYQGQLANQTNREMAASKLRGMIDNTLRWQADRNRQHKLNEEKFQHDKSYDMNKLGMEKEKLGMTKELYNLKKQRDESEKENPKTNDIYKKSNEKALEEARSSLSSLPALKSNLKNLRALAEKLDTGPTKGRIAKLSSTAGSLIGVGKAEDIDNFDALTNQLVLDLGNQLKGSQIALGKLKIIEQSKPQLNKVKGGNLEIIEHMQDLAKLSEEKSNFLLNSLKSNVNAVEAENAFNKYADAKLEYEETGKKFPNKPEDFLEAEKFENEHGEAQPENFDLESMNEEELRRIAGE